jgi:hypothetical protein
MDTIACVTRPAKLKVTPKASTMGHTVGAGCSIVPGERGAVIVPPRTRP